MAFVKSALVGIVTFLIATIAYIPVATTVILRIHHVPPGTHAAFTPRSLFGRPVYWLIAIAAFALGFYWQFRRG